MKNHRCSATAGLAPVLVIALAIAGCASNSQAPVYGRGGQPSQVAGLGKDAYVVKKGDTLYSIARDNGIGYRDLIALNRIENPNQITEGQVLRIRPQVAAESAVVSTMPVTSGEVVARPIGAEQAVEKVTGASGGALKREPKAGKEPYSEQALARAQAAEQVKPVEPIVPAAKPEVKAAEPLAGPDELAWIWPANGKIIGTFSESGSKGVDISGKAGEPVIAASEGKVVYSGTGLRGYGKLVIIKHNNTYLSAYAHNQSVLVREGQNVAKGQKIAEMGSSDADQVKLHFEVRRQGKPVDPLKYLPQR